MYRIIGEHSLSEVQTSMYWSLCEHSVSEECTGVWVNTLDLRYVQEMGKHIASEIYTEVCNDKKIFTGVW